MVSTVSSSDLEPTDSDLGLSREQSSFLTVSFSPRTFVERTLLLAFLFVSELIALQVLSISLKGPLGQGALLMSMRGGWAWWIQPWIFGFAAIFLTFGYLKNKTALEGISGDIRQIPFSGVLFAFHCFAMIVFWRLTSLLNSGVGLRWAELHVGIRFVSEISAIAFAALAFLPWKIWMQLARRTGHLWVYASTAVVLAVLARNALQRLWQPGPLIYLTIHLAKMFLTPFVSGVIADPATEILGTQRFQVKIATPCCGLEGVGLVLMFVVVWLLVFRKECRFPRSLILIPLGVTVIFIFNAVRIAALVLIGNAGAEEIAVKGFHSEAGWIAFSAVCVGFCVIIQRVPWFTTRQEGGDSLAIETHNPTAAFVVPFLMILGAGMIAGAAKGAGGFEWLYPLRFIAAAAALWIFLRSYVGLSWKCDWLAPAIGALVFLIWIVLDRFSNPTADLAVSTQLMAAPLVAKMTWIFFRVMAAVATVPLAEELAFRGFLMRRLVSADFDSISFRRFTWFALLASSVIFGLLHGGYWIAGSIAGLLFGLASIRRGRIGDAVVAHATANALLATYVLTYHKWHLW